MLRGSFQSRAVFVMLTAIFVAASLVYSTLDARGAPAPSTTPLSVPNANWRVIDGDTFEDIRSGVRYRLENIDTPETGPRARCAAERRLGELAKRRARALIANAQRIDIYNTGRIDRYERVIAYISIDGRDLGDLMMAQGVVRPWRGRREPWCDANGALIR